MLLKWRRRGFDNHIKTTLVCPECRYVSRVGSKCPLCGLPLVNVGYKWRIPKKTDTRGWKKLVKLLVGQKEMAQRQADKQVFVIEKGTKEEFKTCAEDYLTS